jgi:hypothetical protein
MSKIIEELKQSVIWEMKWNTEIFPEKPESEQMFDENMALAVLLASDVVFINDHWWKKDDGWPEDACKMISLNVNTNDVLTWGAADAYTMQYSDLREVYEHWAKDPTWGTAVWYCKRMKLMPQEPVAERIRAAGIWDIDGMGLRPNNTDQDNNTDNK